MRLGLGLGFPLLLLLQLQQQHVHAAAGGELVMNGWYNCSIDTFPSNDATETDELIAQCALIQVPLCHKDVSCTNNKTIELFVKRVLSSSPTTSPDVWFIQGGPGESSDGMESGMQDLIKARNGDVNVYTVDHRGTGRSNKFDCVAAEATTPGSPGGKRVTFEEFAGCSAELTMQYGVDLSAFSVTSAASDVAWLINGLKSNGGVFVYGLSYGTAVVERLMHLNVAAISGYILDGVATTSGAASDNNYEYFSTGDVDFGLVGDRLLELCRNDTFCGGKFGSKGPSQTLQDLYTRIDSNEEKASCTGLFEISDEDDKPSYAVRRVFADLLQTTERRTLIPVLIFRMDRCDEDDKSVLQHFFNSLNGPNDSGDSTNAFYTSSLLDELISYSEMWEYPRPFKNAMKERFTSQLISDGEAYSSWFSSCLYLMDKESAACQELNISWNALPKNTLPIAYKRDQYWNTSAQVIDNASVLILNGKLDPQTHYRYAESLYEAIQAKPNTQKKLLLFEYLPHETIFTSDEAAEEGELPCALKILASYVENGGQLAALNTSCMQSMKPINFDIDSTLSQQYFGTKDAYDGTLE